MHEIKRASLERDFMHRPSADGVINIHTARHKSNTQHKHAPQRHHSTTKQPSLPRLVQMYLINIGHHTHHSTLYGVRPIKPPSSSQPSEGTAPSPAQLHLQDFCFVPLKVHTYSPVFSFPVQLQEVYHLIFLPYTVGIHFHDM